MNAHPHTRKMESADMAAAIAQDFNNILCAIFWYAEMALEHCPPETIAARNLEKVLVAGTRAKDLIAKIEDLSALATQEVEVARVCTARDTPCG